MSNCNQKCDENGKPIIYKGEDGTVSVRLVSKGSKDPFDVSVCSEIEAILPKEDGTFLVKKLSTNGVSILSAAGGHILVILDAADTTLLAASLNGGYTDMEVDLTISGKKKFVNIKDAVQIIPKPYPAS